MELDESVDSVDSVDVEYDLVVEKEEEKEEEKKGTIGPFFDVLENLKKSNFDPSIFDKIDERDFPKAPNFLEWAIGPQYLNTLILPKQIYIGAYLFCDFCPRCSKPGYIDTLFDQSVGNIRDNIVFLEHGACPKCKVTRYELLIKKELLFRNELVGVCGQRCIPKDSLVFTENGIFPLKEVNVGMKLSHGPVVEKIDSGVLPSIKIHTSGGFVLTGAKETHVVPVVRYENEKYNIEFIFAKDCRPNDHLLLHFSEKWPRQYYVTENKNTVTESLAHLLGYIVARANKNNNVFRVSIEKNNDFFEKAYLEVLGKPPIWDDTLRGYTLTEPDIEFLNHFGVNFISGLVPNKYIPSCILQSPRSVVIEFLKAIFSKSYKNRKGGIGRFITVRSEVLAKQIQLLLLNLGVYSVLSERKHKNASNFFLRVVGSFYKKLMYEFEFGNAPGKKVEFIHTVCMSSNKRFFEKNYKSWPQEIKDIIQFGYYPVSIKKIEDGIEYDMADVSIPNTNIYVADGFVHHNSGKTKFVGLAASYISHRLLKIPSPVRTYNQTSGDILVGTFSALSMDHSYRTLWQAFKGFMDGSPWFQNYHRFLKAEEKSLGIELFHELKASMFYTHKHILWNATGSQDKKMRGDTRIFAAIDELGHMISDEQKKDLQNMNADEIYAVLTNSLTTMRTKYNIVYNEDNYDLPPIIMCNISSPSSAKDKIMRLAKDANKNDKIFAVHLPTWNMNPDFTYELLREEMAHVDELTFMRDFGAEPPLASNPFLPEPRIIDKIAVGPSFDNFTLKEIQEKDFLGDAYKSAKLILTKGDRLIPRLIALDLGAMKNSLALCMFSMTPDIKPKLDFALTIKPDPTTKVRVNISAFFEDFLVPLVNNFRIVHAFFDRWQSLDHIERLISLKVKAQTYSLSYKEMDSVRGSILSQSVIIPKMEKPVEVYVKEYVDGAYHTDALTSLSLQLLTVRDLGHKMAKPLLGDDDVFRAFCLGVSRLADTTVKREYLNSLMRTAAGHSVAHIGVVRSMRDKSGGGQLSLIEGDGGRHIGSVRGRGANKRS